MHVLLTCKCEYRLSSPGGNKDERNVIPREVSQVLLLLLLLGFFSFSLSLSFFNLIEL